MKRANEKYIRNKQKKKLLKLCTQTLVLTEKNEANNKWNEIHQTFVQKITFKCQPLKIKIIKRRKKKIREKKRGKRTGPMNFILIGYLSNAEMAKKTLCQKEKKFMYEKKHIHVHTYICIREPYNNIHIVFKF